MKSSFNDYFEAQKSLAKHKLHSQLVKGDSGAYADANLVEHEHLTLTRGGTEQLTQGKVEARRGSGGGHRGGDGLGPSGLPNGVNQEPQPRMLSFEDLIELPSRFPYMRDEVDITDPDLDLVDIPGAEEAEEG